MDKRLTVVKIFPKNGLSITFDDMEKWRKIFEEHSVTDPEIAENDEIQIEYLDIPEDDSGTVKISVSSSDYQFSGDDLRDWQKMFDEGKDDPNFIIFTHANISIEISKEDKPVAVE